MQIKCTILVHTRNSALIHMHMYILGRGVFDDVLDYVYDYVYVVCLYTYVHIIPVGMIAYEHNVLVHISISMIAYEHNALDRMRMNIMRWAVCAYEHNALGRMS